MKKKSEAFVPKKNEPRGTYILQALDEHFQRAHAHFFAGGAAGGVKLQAGVRQLEERAGMTVDALLEKFRTSAGKELDNDRILLSDRE